ncbi:MAG: hypothetical protein ACOC8B_04830 [Gemmatimonadota bacterium]
MRPAHRAAFVAYRRGRRFRRRAASWSDDRRRAWILHRLRTITRRAWRESPYYRELFDDVGFDPNEEFGFDDFAGLPALERQTIHDAGDRMLSNAVPRSELRRDATGGSTGEPVAVWKGPLERGWSESGGEHYLARVGVPPGSRRALLWGHHLDPVGSERLLDRFRTLVVNARWFDCFRLSPEIIRRHHAEMEAWRPWCIIAYAGALGRFAEALEDWGIEPSYPGRGLVTGAEKLLPEHRAVIERRFQRRVHERYGSREVGLVAFQVELDPVPVYEVDWSNVLVEPESDAVDAPILVTKLHADGMPMLRYRIGDVARFPDHDRPGHPSLRLLDVRGRELDRIWLAPDRWIDAIEFPHLMKDHPVRNFQVVQNADLTVSIRLVPADGFDEQDRRRILETVRSNLPNLDVDLELRREIPTTASGKRRPVISHVEWTDR